MLNPLIGDLGALGAGRQERERVAAHLRFVHGVLARASVSHLEPAQRAARGELLARLAAYADAREFPRPAFTRGQFPVFVDTNGTRCAVAELVAHAEGPGAAREIDAQFHTAHVADMAHPALTALCAASGLTPVELALIQPAYGEPVEPPPAIQWLAGTEVAAAVASGAGHTDSPAHALVDGELRWVPPHNYYLGDPIVELDGAIGAESGGRVPYAISLRAGTEARWYPGELIGPCTPCSAHRTGIVAGVRLDADGSRVPQAWTIPIDAHWYVPWLDPHARIGVVGGARIRFAGADRAVGWSAGLDVEHDLSPDFHWSAPNELHVGVSIEQVADLTFVGVTLALASRDRYVALRDW